MGIGGVWAVGWGGTGEAAGRALGAPRRQCPHEHNPASPPRTLSPLPTPLFLKLPRVWGGLCRPGGAGRARGAPDDDGRRHFRRARWGSGRERLGHTGRHSGFPYCSLRGQGQGPGPGRVQPPLGGGGRCDRARRLSRRHPAASLAPAAPGRFLLSVWPDQCGPGVLRGGVVAGHAAGHGGIRRSGCARGGTGWREPK